ncbi:MAG: GHKL domain-containing protein, partial [Alphaproteobacteria bacterium]|nr:GHKL domain-containing protein [Alphaproteobacteria bacterium]
NFTDLLAKRYKDKLDERAAEYVRIIVDSARRMQEMIADLLEYARSGQEAERFTRVDTALELQHVTQNLGETIAKSGGRITHGPLPEINGNPVRFMRLLQNLVGNALKYQREGVRPEIHISAEDKKDHWLFSVRDNGIGIRKEYLEKIFVPFKRLHTKQQFQGTGIGLAICRKIVESHGGRIWAESEPGAGSAFYFTIPKIKL